jgi:hypothetical protein
MSKASRTRVPSASVKGWSGLKTPSVNVAVIIWPIEILLLDITRRRFAANVLAFRLGLARLSLATSATAEATSRGLA